MHQSTDYADYTDFSNGNRKTYDLQHRIYVICPICGTNLALKTAGSIGLFTVSGISSQRPSRLLTRDQIAYVYLNAGS